MTATLVLFRYQQAGHAADGGKGSRVGSDPVAEPLRPARFGIGEVGGAEHGDKNLRRPGLAVEPIDDHRHRVAGVIDKQLVAAGMGLPHRHRQPRCPNAVQVAEAGVAIPVRAALDVFVPQDLQCDVLALQLAVNLGPVGLGVPAMALLGADRGEEVRLQCRVAQFRRQRPAELGRRQSL